MPASSSTATATTVMSGSTSGGSMLPGPPPPTPSNHHHPLPSANAGGTDAALSAFLHRMLLSSQAPPLRSPPVARSQAAPSLPPLVALDTPDPRALRDAADTGYFHLAGHGVPSELPTAALAELAQVNASTRREANLRTLGFPEEEDEEEQNADDPALVFEASEGEADALPAAVAEYARRMRDIGMRVVAMLSGCPDVGFGEDPFAEGRRNARCLVWASKVSGAGETASAPPAAGKAKAYPYVIGLHSQWEAAAGKEAAPGSWVMNDGGEWASVGARDGALLVTIGDIAQVWSNGKLKKVRGIARPTSAPSKDGQHSEPADRLSVTVLITLPLDSVISPLVPFSEAVAGDEGHDDETDGAGGDGDEWRFNSFLLEDYAWRVYHQRLQFKDPLVRYRI